MSRNDALTLPVAAASFPVRGTDRSNGHRYLEGAAAKLICGKDTSKAAEDDKLNETRVSGGGPRLCTNTAVDPLDKKLLANW
jgi:hypothetical protein